MVRDRDRGGRGRDGEKPVGDFSSLIIEGELPEAGMSEAVKQSRRCLSRERDEEGRRDRSHAGWQRLAAFRRMKKWP